MNRKSMVGLWVIGGLVLGLSPSAAANPFDSTCDLDGQGSFSEPYLLKRESDLLEMETCLISGSTSHYALANDIFMSAGIGDAYRDAYFDEREDAYLDGRGFGIFGLRLGDPSGLEVGLFGDVSDLTVTNITVQAGAIVGGNETGILVGEVDRLVVDNVAIVVDSFSCSDECGLVAGRVTENATISDVTVVAMSFIGGDESGLLIGELAGDARITNVNATATVGFGNEGRVGGLIGNVSSFQNLTIQNAYVAFDDSRLDETYKRPDFLGGLIGTLTSELDSQLLIGGVAVVVDLFGVTNYGGLIGRTQNLDFGDTPTMEVEIRDVRIDGRVTYLESYNDIQGGGISGGLLGPVDNESTLNLDVADALISLRHRVSDFDTLVSVSSVVETVPANLTGNGFSGLTFSNVVLNTTIWDGSTVSDMRKNTEPGILERTSSDLNSEANVPFGNLVENPGVLGTDDWEMCAGGGPFPTFTPNACVDPDLTMSANQVSVELAQSATAIVDTSRQGFGESLFFTIEPSLPIGLALNPVTGEISGTALELRTAGTYIIKKYNAASNPFSYIAFDSHAESFVVVETLLPVVQSSQQTPPAPPAAAAPPVYSGPILAKFSTQSLIEGASHEILVQGERLSGITEIRVDDKTVDFSLLSGQLMKIFIPALEPGGKTLVLKSDAGTLFQQNAFRVTRALEKVVVPTQTEASIQKLTIATFNGRVAVFAKGYQGKRLSVKFGSEWIVVESIPEVDVFRTTRKINPGTELVVQVFVDRVLVKEEKLRTK